MLRKLRHIYHLLFGDCRKEYSDNFWQQVEEIRRKKREEHDA